MEPIAASPGAGGQGAGRTRSGHASFPVGVSRRDGTDAPLRCGTRLALRAARAEVAVPPVLETLRECRSSAGCSTRATTRLAMNRAVRTAEPLRVSSVTSTSPRRLTTSTRRPARVAATS